MSASLVYQLLRQILQMLTLRLPKTSSALVRTDVRVSRLDSKSCVAGARAPE